MYLQHLFLCFFNRRTDSWGSDIFFLNLNKIECISGELFKDRVKLVCRSYLSLGTFLNRILLHTMRRENSAFPYFTLFPVNFLKDDQRVEEGKVLNCTHTLRKTSVKGTGKWKLSTARWVYNGAIFSTKTDRPKRPWNNSQDPEITPPRGKTQKFTISDFLAFSISRFSHCMYTPKDIFSHSPRKGLFS